MNDPRSRPRCGLLVERLEPRSEEDLQHVASRITVCSSIVAPCSGCNPRPSGSLAGMVEERAGAKIARRGMQVISWLRVDLYAELRELVRALDDAQVDYALCGGLANISVVSRRALISLKLSAGRPQDLVDVQNLEALGDD